MPLASDSGTSRFSLISPRRFSHFGENFMRETISFAVSIVSENNLQFFVVSFTLKLSKSMEVNTISLWLEVLDSFCHTSLMLLAPSWHCPLQLTNDNCSFNNTSFIADTIVSEPMSGTL